MYHPADQKILTEAASALQDIPVRAAAAVSISLLLFCLLNRNVPRPDTFHKYIGQFRIKLRSLLFY